MVSSALYICHFPLQAPHAPLTRLISVWIHLYSPQHLTQYLLFRLEEKAASSWRLACAHPPCLQWAHENRGKQRTRQGPPERGLLAPRCSNIPNWSSLLHCCFDSTFLHHACTPPAMLAPSSLHIYSSALHWKINSPRREPEFLLLLTSPGNGLSILYNMLTLKNEGSRIVQEEMR